MTPQEKARELIDKFIEASIVEEEENYYHPKPYSLSKQCALIAVEEILNNNCGSSMSEADIAYKNEIYCDEYFWQDVEAEIKKL